MTGNPIAFVLASTDHGSLIVNRFDNRLLSNGDYNGVGHQLLSSSVFDPEEIKFGKWILDRRREFHGDGLVALDIGANIGVMAVEWGRHMRGWGQLHAYEPQDRIFYALAGNVALNNLYNVSAHYAAVGAVSGTIDVPRLSHTRNASFGSLELKRGPDGRRIEDIGQPINDKLTDAVPLLAVDDMPHARVDFMKIDVEGMELEVLRGAENTLRAWSPYLFFEHLKSSQDALTEFLESLNYRQIPGIVTINTMAMHVDDPIWNVVDKVRGKKLK